MYPADLRTLGPTPVLMLVAATSLVACSSNGLRGLGLDAGADASTSDASTSDVPTSGHDVAGPFNPCPAAPEPAGGTIPAGQPCTSPQECVRAAGESAACGPSNTADVQAKVQTCHRFTRVVSGAACAASRTLSGELVGRFPGVNPGETLPAQAGLCDARDGLTCDWATHTCASFAVLGADCTARSCISGTHCANGVCAAPVTVGQRCDVGADIAGPSWCEAGAFCDIGTALCVRKRVAGSACVLGFECESGFCKGVCSTLGAECIP